MLHLVQGLEFAESALNFTLEDDLTTSVGHPRACLQMGSWALQLLYRTRSKEDVEVNRMCNPLA